MMKISVITFYLLKKRFHATLYLLREEAELILDQEVLCIRLYLHPRSKQLSSQLGFNWVGFYTAINRYCGERRKHFVAKSLTLSRTPAFFYYVYSK